MNGSTPQRTRRKAELSHKKYTALFTWKSSGSWPLQLS
jgi:hypothetical protein